MLEPRRGQIYRLHLELPKNNLVAWTSGNVGVRDPETGLVVTMMSSPLTRHIIVNQIVGCNPALTRFVTRYTNL